ncbi:MAG: hypothetical protein WBE26_10815 [Phycisphaerae bacterium]
MQTLEPALRAAVARGDCVAAQRIVSDIQDLLAPTGHTARLMRAKNWFFEAKMEAGSLVIAEPGFIGVRRKVGPNTRVYLEATALLAICLIRGNRIEEAEDYISETVKRLRNIKSSAQQQAFRRSILTRFDEEAVVIALKGVGNDELDPATVQEKAGTLVRQVDEHEIYRSLGQVVPLQKMKQLLEVRSHCQKLLTKDELKALPSPETLAGDVEHGKTIFSAIRRRAWRAICDPESEVYQVWTKGMEKALNTHVLAGAVASTLLGWKIGVYSIAVYVTALVLKVGLEGFCDVSKPHPLMGTRAG